MSNQKSDAQKSSAMREINRGNGSQSQKDAQKSDAFRSINTDRKSK